MPTFPPWFLAICLTMLSPRPAPRLLGTTRQNGSKTRCSYSGSDARAFVGDDHFAARQDHDLDHSFAVENGIVSTVMDSDDFIDLITTEAQVGH